MRAVVEEDCLIIDALDCSHCVSEIIDLCKFQNSKVYVYCGKVQVSKTSEFEVLFQKQFHKVSFQLYN